MKFHNHQHINQNFIPQLPVQGWTILIQILLHMNIFNFLNEVVTFMTSINAGLIQYWCILYDWFESLQCSTKTIVSWLMSTQNGHMTGIYGTQNDHTTGIYGTQNGHMTNIYTKRSHGQHLHKIKHLLHGRHLHM